MMPNSNYSSSTFWLGLNTEYSHVRLASVGRDVACISAAFLNSKSSRVRASHGAMMAVLSRSKSWSAPENQTNPGAKLIHSSSARGWKTYGSLRIILRPASTNTVNCVSPANHLLHCYLLLHVLKCHVPGDSYTCHVSARGGGQWSQVCRNTDTTGPGSLCVCGYCPVSTLPLERKPVDLSTT